MKTYVDWGKTDIRGFMRFLDTMKIHGIIEKKCEELISNWRTNIELVRHRVIWLLSICRQLLMHAHGAPARLPVNKWPWFSTSPVTFENTPKKATRSTSKMHSRISSSEIFGLKYLVLRLHRPTAQIPLKAELIFSSFQCFFWSN